MTATGNTSHIPQNVLCEKCSDIGIDPRFLRTSYVPSQSEIRQMKETIEGESQLKEIEEPCSCLSERIRQRRSVVSALRRVPFELWRDIFHLCEEESYCLTFDTNPSFRSPWHTDDGGVVIIPRLLSRVCSRWRDIINNSPCLWSSISIRLNSKTHPRIHIPLAVHLRNSKDHPLTLGVKPYAPNESDRAFIMASAENIFRVLLPHIWRCDFLDMRLGSFGPLLEHALSLGKPSPFTFTHLKCLLFDMGFAERDLTSSFWKALAQAPKLEVAMIDDFSYPQAVLPYHQLTHLDVRFTIDETLFPVLSACQSLQSLHLDCFLSTDYDELDSEFTSNPVILPTLRDLHMYIPRFPDDLHALFAKFAFPSLRMLEVSCHDDVSHGTLYRLESEWSPYFLPNLERSASQITHLKLKLDNLLLWIDLDVASVLKVTPNVTHLELELSSCSSDPLQLRGSLVEFLLEHLRVSSPGSSLLVPKLTHLYLYDDSHRWWNLRLVELILGVLESRSSLILGDRTDVSPLSEFHLVYCDTRFNLTKNHCEERECDTLSEVFGALELVRQHEARHGMRCRIAHATSGVIDAKDPFDHRLWTELDEQLKDDHRDPYRFLDSSEDGSEDSENEGSDSDGSFETDE
ncbi:hypothetical protein L218DRAFT_963880 [Marasmius fiardii PR-910]|nr:hypothetical protein L218DRAFT_963880 [Marasmius fiardii PR-910]